MKIYTRTGDKGKTSLLGGSRLLKSDLRVEAYGNVDELNSWLGYVISTISNEDIKQNLIDIQRKLFTVGSWLALNDKEDGEKYNLELITQYDIDILEKGIDRMDEKLEPLKNFILPGGNDIMGRIHITRTVCRRAERSIIRADESDLFIIKYINRLSDYFFTLARYVGYIDNVEETKVL